jgi:hypothetical protein
MSIEKPSGIEPATFHLVTQCLNTLRHTRAADITCTTMPYSSLIKFTKKQYVLRKLYLNVWYCVSGECTFNVHVFVLHFLFQERNYRLNSRTYDIRTFREIETCFQVRELPQQLDSNKSTNQCNSSTSLLLDVYVWLNMFRAPPRSSSGAYNCISSLWFYRWSVVVAALLVVVLRPRPTLLSPRSNGETTGW